MATLQKQARTRKSSNASTQLRFAWMDDRSTGGAGISTREKGPEKTAVSDVLPVASPKAGGEVARILPATNRPSNRPQRLGSPAQIGSLLEAVLGRYGISREEIAAELALMAANSQAAT